MLGILVISLQRFAIPVDTAQIPLNAVLVLAWVLWLLMTGGMRVEALVSVLFLAFLSFASLLSMITDGSVPSIFLVGALWSPICLLSDSGWARSFLSGVAATTAVAGVASVIQSLFTYFGGSMIDPIASVPTQFLLQGYATSYEVVYGSGWMKANGLFFLEPSLLSLFCCLSLVILASGSVHLGRFSGGAVIALVLGLLSSVAISGLVVAPALALAAWSKGLRWKVAGGLLMVSLLLFASPQGAAFIDRAFAQGGTSNEARLIRPYTTLLPDVFGAGAVAGFGPGSARRFVEQHFLDWQSEVTTPTIVKTVFEYGIVGLVFLALACAYLYRRSSLPASLKLALLAALLVPTDGLASSIIAPVVILSLIPSFASESPMPPARAQVRSSTQDGDQGSNMGSGFLAAGARPSRHCAQGRS